jgi:fimbrial chaperone protein
MVNDLKQLLNNAGTTAGLSEPIAFALSALCALALFAPALVSAAEWNVDPVRIELSPQQQTAAIIVRNESDQPSSIQIQAVTWSQVNGLDVYTPTRELLVSPPIATIPPKTDQVIRVALRRPADPSKELAYRINLQELPHEQAPESTGIQVALRIGLPVFVQSLKGDAAPKMAWSVARAPDNQIKVQVKNQGNAHVQISDFSLQTAGATQPVTSESALSYVLAGQTREWLLKTNPSQAIANGRLRLMAFTDADKVDTELVLGSP